MSDTYLADEIRAIITEGKAQFATVEIVQDGAWIVSALSRLIAAAKRTKGLTAAGKKAEVMSAWALVNEAVPALKRTTTDERIVEILYIVGAWIFPHTLG